jgi:hypothetical protein
MMRRCSHCSHNGHNSRTCPNRGVKIFGVRLTDGSIRKSASMGNLSLLAGSSAGGGGASPADVAHDAAAEGYASDDFVQGSSSANRERKKGDLLNPSPYLSSPPIQNRLLSAAAAAAHTRSSRLQLLFFVRVYASCPVLPSVCSFRFRRYH